VQVHRKARASSDKWRSRLRGDDGLRLALASAQTNAL